MGRSLADPIHVHAEAPPRPPFPVRAGHQSRLVAMAPMIRIGCQFPISICHVRAGIPMDRPLDRQTGASGFRPISPVAAFPTMVIPIHVIRTIGIRIHAGRAMVPGRHFLVAGSRVEAATRAPHAARRMVLRSCSTGSIAMGTTIWWEWPSVPADGWCGPTC